MLLRRQLGAQAHILHLGGTAQICYILPLRCRRASRFPSEAFPRFPHSRFCVTIGV